MQPNSCRIDPSARVSDRAKLGKGCFIGPRVKIAGPARLGNTVWLDSDVTIHGGAIIGKSTYIGIGCIIGYPKRKSLKDLVQGKSVEIGGSGRSVLGKRCILRPGSTIYTDVNIGDDVELGHNSILREDVTVGDNSVIGTNVVIDGETTIGKGVSIQTGAYICKNSRIEDFVFLGPYSVFTNDRYPMQHKSDLKGPTVRRGASIGANSTLMAGVVIGNGALIGAHAVVTVDVPPRTIFVGVPARQARRAPRGWRPLLEEQQKKNRTNR